MKKIFTLFIITLLICGCSNKNKSEVEKLMAENDYIIVDVRTKEEYDEGHLVDAINIPYDQIDGSLDKDKLIFVYCKSGNRSKIAYNKLVELGYSVYDLGSYSQINLPKE